MVVSILNTRNVTNSTVVVNQSTLESTMHWRQSPESTSPDAEQSDCKNFSNQDESFSRSSSSNNNNNNNNMNNNNNNNNNNDEEERSFTMSVDQRPSSPLQAGEENSCYGSDNGAENLSPPQETSRSSGSEDTGVGHSFPISGNATTPQSFDYCSEDENSQGSPPSPSSYHEDGSYRTGKGGCSGKAKTHKCRTCDFSSTDKHDFWKHVELHLKPEKILRCPLCPFVTEYKHHLDFHTWNHQGRKPYKCDQCNYHCVNKSMLKSHLKSHSNVYQFSCKNCSYRTKYCHSLKIHLRKYGHNPGIVLDADGNPNPNPIIDVYGNRRGPRQKSKKSSTDETVTATPVTTGADAASVSPATALPLQTSMSPLNAFPNLPWMSNMFFTENPRLPARPVLSGAAVMSAPPPTFPHNDIARIASQEIDSYNNNSNKINNNNINNNNNNNHHMKMKVCKSINNNNSNNHNNNINIITENSNSRVSLSNPYSNKKKSINNNNSKVNNLNCSSLLNDSSCLLYSTTSGSGTSVKFSKRYSTSDDEEDMLQPETSLGGEAAPATNIDVFVSAMSAKPPTFERSASVVEMRSGAVEEAPLNLTVTHVAACAPKKTSVPTTTAMPKSRRKGPAFKLKRSAVEEVDDVRGGRTTSAMETTESAAPATAVEAAQCLTTNASSDDTTNSEQSKLLNKLKSEKCFYCAFCEITFFNHVMFTMHMGYHGFTDPFTCNRCGKKTEDRVDFYAHMISDAHH